jgi:hypothetical protein
MSRIVAIVLVISLALLAVLPLITVLPAAADPPDYDIPAGHFYSQAAGPGETGYAVTDESGVPFWSEFRRLGGVDAVGYPVSGRFNWNGFVCQAMQRVVFQWRPDSGQVSFVNVFDLMTQAGKDDWLLAARQTPKPYAFNEAGLTWQQIVDQRLAVLDANPAIKAAYLSVVGDPVTMNGLPTSQVMDMGNNFTLRAQRVVIQQWKQDLPWASADQVTVALGGSIAKEAGLLPLGSAPVSLPPAPTATTELPSAIGEPVCLSTLKVVSFKSSPQAIVSPNFSTISWEVIGADTVVITPEVGSVAQSGSAIVRPSATTTYKLTASGCDGEAFAYTTVNVSGGTASTSTPLPSLPGPGLIATPTKATTVAPTQPANDLAVTSIYLQANDNLGFTVVHKGQLQGIFKFRITQLCGTPQTSSFYHIGDSFASIPQTSVPVMINTEFTFIVNPVCTGTIQIQIDPDNAIAETDKVNNRMTKEFPKTW